jgi:hypothetical protein
MNSLAVVLLFLAALAYATLQGLVSEEASGWIRALARGIVRLAARTLPRDQRERWAEEMLGDLAHVSDRPITGFVHALYALAHARELTRAAAKTHPVRKSLVMSYAIEAPVAGAVASAGPPTMRSTEVYCLDCGAKLVERSDEADRKPCPTCSSMRRRIAAQAWDRGTLISGRPPTKTKGDFYRH